jgi:hypothetical protein
MMNLGRMLQILDDPHFNNIKNQPETWLCYSTDVVTRQDGSRIRRYHLRESRQSRGRLLRIDCHEDATYCYELQDQFRTCSDFDVHFFANEDLTVAALGEKFNRIACSAYRPLGDPEAARIESEKMLNGGLVESFSDRTMIRDYFGVDDGSHESLLSVDRGRSVTRVWWGFSIEAEQINLI